MAAHPGPWTAENAEAPHADGSDGCAWGVVAGDRIVVMHDFVGKADAILIAAAPDMLAELKCVLESYENADSAESFGQTFDIDSVIAVIAKAEGR